MISHIKSQGNCENYNFDFKKDIEEQLNIIKTILGENQVTDSPFTVSEVKRSINSLKNNKSTGPKK